MLNRNILLALTFFITITASLLIGSEYDSSYTHADIKTIAKSQKLHLINADETLLELSDSIPVTPYKEKIDSDKKRDKDFRIFILSELKKILKNSRQFLIIISKDWDAKQGILNYYEKKKDKLLKMSDDIHVNLGHSGLGWGNGLVDFDKSLGPVKHEGDGKSPAGVFKLSYSFGYLPIDSLSWLNYPYKQVTSKIECVDDTTSEYYNTLVNVDETDKTWNSSEVMKSAGIHYKFGIFVDHNSNPPVPGCGSCIFIHIWDGLGKSTVGCTTLSEEQIIKLMSWLNAKKKPLLIQLPEIEFNKIKFLLNL